jgi:hypothetical protein
MHKDAPAVGIGTRTLNRLFHLAEDPNRRHPMRPWLLVLLAVLPLSACISSSPAPTIVVPQGATVICPNGSNAVYSNGAYRC